MKKYLILLLPVAIVMLSFQITTAQVYDYTTWNTTQCNAFYPSAVINGSTHTTTCGTVQYSNVKRFLYLPNATTNTNIYSGTEYKMSYNFKQGYSYTIKVNAICGPVTFPERASTLRVDFLSASNALGGFCNGPEPINGTSSWSNGNNYDLNPGAYFDYTFTFSNLAVARNFLYLGSINRSVNLSVNSYIGIKKVTITETQSAPPITFTLTPNNVAKTCGIGLSQTFSVNNVNSTPGVTSYNWNLGSQPNGWYYLGSPAPATLSTSVNSITLDANPCDLPPKNITAAAIIGANSYATNAANVSANNPSLSITGNNVLCAGSSVYSVDNIPCGGTVTWSVSPSGKVSLTPNGNQVTVNYITNGNVVLTANVSISCTAQTIPINKSIAVGIPVGWDFPIFGPPILGLNQIGSYSTMYYDWVTYNWYAPGFAWGGGPGPACSAMSTPFPGAGQIILEVSNGCGTITGDPMLNVQFVPWGRQFNISPNPAKNSVTVSPNRSINMQNGPSELQNNKPARELLIYALKITDNSGVVKRMAEFKSGIRQVNLQFNGLLPGTYILSVFDGTRWESQSLVIQ